MTQDSAQASPTTLLLCCHGGPIRTLLAGVQGIPLRSLQQRVAPIRNTSVTILQARDGRFHVLAEADVSHLNLTPSEEHDVD